MRVLIAIAVAIVSLSGCLADDEPTTDPSPSDGSMGQTPEEEENTVTYSCIVDVGVPAVSISGNANVGGCQLADITSAHVVVTSTPAEFCTIQVDLDADTLADEQAMEGKTYEAGASFTAFCDPPAVDAENSIALMRV